MTAAGDAGDPYTQNWPSVGSFAGDAGDAGDRNVDFKRRARPQSQKWLSPESQSASGVFVTRITRITRKSLGATGGSKTRQAMEGTKMIANTVPLAAHYPRLDGGVASYPVIAWADSPSPLREVDPVVVCLDGARRLDSDGVLLLPADQRPGPEHSRLLQALLVGIAREEIRESPLLTSLAALVGSRDHLSRVAAEAGTSFAAARAELATHADTLALAGYNVELDGADGAMVTVTLCGEGAHRSLLADRLAATPASVALRSPRAAAGGGEGW